MTENPFAIELTDVTKRYADILATDSISFRVKETEFFGLLGPNGAGKTTTINMMASILKPTEGELRIWGPLSGGLYARYDIGTRKAGRFEGVENGRTVTTGETGGAYSELWFGPLVRAQWAYIFAELGYGLLGIRSDDARETHSQGHVRRGRGPRRGRAPA